MRQHILRMHFAEKQFMFVDFGCVCVCVSVLLLLSQCISILVLLFVCYVYHHLFIQFLNSNFLLNSSFINDCTRKINSTKSLFPFES